MAFGHMEIRPANAAIVDADDRLSRLGSGIFDIPDHQRPTSLFEDRSLHHPLL
jgi:hypothetical protein